MVLIGLFFFCLMLTKFLSPTVAAVQCGRLSTTEVFYHNRTSDYSSNVCYVVLSHDEVKKIRENFFKDTSSSHDSSIVLNKTHALKMCHSMHLLASLIKGNKPEYRTLQRITPNITSLTLPNPQNEADLQWLIDSKNIPNSVQFFLHADVNSGPRKPAPDKRSSNLKQGDCGYFIKDSNDSKFQGVVYVDCDQPYNDAKKDRVSKTVICEIPAPAKCLGLEKPIKSCELVGKECKESVYYVITQQPHPQLAYPCDPYKNGTTTNHCPKTDVEQLAICKGDCIYTEWKPTSANCKHGDIVPCIRQTKRNAVGLGKPCNGPWSKNDVCPTCESSGNRQFSCITIMIFSIFMIAFIRMSAK